MPDYENYLLKKQLLREEAESGSIPAELKPCWVEPLLSLEQGLFLARKFNFLKFLVATAFPAAAEILLNQEMPPFLEIYFLKFGHDINLVLAHTNTYLLPCSLRADIH